MSISSSSSSSSNSVQLTIDDWHVQGWKAAVIVSTMLLVYHGIFIGLGYGLAQL